MNDALSMSCKTCGEKWLELLPLPMEITVFAGRLKELTCPYCGAGSEALRCLFGAAAEAVHK